MTEVLIGIVLFLASFGGGYWKGTKDTEKKAHVKILHVLNESANGIKGLNDSLTVVNGKLDSTLVELLNVRDDLKVSNKKLDSLQSLPPKVDTLILISKRTLENTDTIKNEVRVLAKDLKKTYIYEPYSRLE